MEKPTLVSARRPVSVHCTTQLVGEYQLSFTAVGIGMLLAIYRNALKPGSDGGISVDGMATSLGRPPKTIRRHAHMLASQ